MSPYQVMRMFSRKKPEDLNEKERVKNLFHNKPSYLRKIPAFRNSTPKICKIDSIINFIYVLAINKPKIKPELTL